MNDLVSKVSSGQQGNIFRDIYDKLGHVESAVKNIKLVVNVPQSPSTPITPTTPAQPTSPFAPTSPVTPVTPTGSKIPEKTPIKSGADGDQQQQSTYDPGDPDPLFEGDDIEPHELDLISDP